MNFNQEDLKLQMGERMALELLCHNPWRAFYTQGGNIKPLQINQEKTSKGIFSISELVIDCGRKILITATAIDVCPSEEIFRILIWEDSDFGQPVWGQRVRPPRKMVTYFPKNLNLGAFLNNSITVKLIEGFSQAKDTALIYHKGVVFKNLAGQELSIVVDEFVPLNIELTTL